MPREGTSFVKVPVKSILRSIAAILLGWGAGAGIVAGLTYLLYLCGRSIAPDEFQITDPEAGLPSPGLVWLIFLLGIGALGALVAGCVVSMFSQSRPTRRAFILAVLMTSGAIGASLDEKALPLWFSLTLIVSTPVCVLVGATLHCRYVRGGAC